MRFVVGPVSEFPPGTRRIVKAGVREIGVFRENDEFYAVRNRCPHNGAPLCEGPFRHKLVSDAPGVVSVDKDGTPLVICPWHGWQYDARTGEAYAPGDAKVRSYGISVQPGSEVTEDAEPKVALVAETFTVTVEDDYVVIDV
jgi:nitrite reductase/ring-hydroxylating ferredoxin subunit